MITGAVVSAITAGAALAEPHMDVAARQTVYTEHLQQQLLEMQNTVSPGAHIITRQAMTVVACKVPGPLISTKCSLFTGLATCDRISKACLACYAHGTNSHQGNTCSTHKLSAGCMFHIGAAGWTFRLNPGVENPDGRSACLSLTDCQRCPFYNQRHNHCHDGVLPHLAFAVSQHQERYRVLLGFVLSVVYIVSLAQMSTVPDLLLTFCLPCTLHC